MICAGVRHGLCISAELMFSLHEAHRVRDELSRYSKGKTLNRYTYDNSRYLKHQLSETDSDLDYMHLVVHNCIFQNSF